MIRWISQKWLVIILHIAFWLLLFSLPFVLHPETTTAGNPAVSIFQALRYLTWIGFFYLNAYVFIPKFIYTRQYATYFFLQLLVIITLVLLNFMSYRVVYVHPHFHGLSIGFTTFPYIFIWACSTAYQMFRNNIATDKLTNEKEKENLKTELSFLRSQVSPHFMFNVLNNMVALARKNSEQLEPSLIKLSSLLRYMLYETDEEKKPLQKEIEYLQSYIDLQQQRFGKIVAINTYLQQDDINYLIEPMLLIPFVENAFKHGVVVVDEAEIDVDLKVRDGILQFSVKNRFSETSENTDKTPGIGLNNVKRRLELLYAGKFVLHIDKLGGWYTVSLQLNLK